MEQTATETLSIEPTAAVAAVSSSQEHTAETTTAETEPQPRRGRWVRIAIAAIKAVLFIELAGTALGPLAAAGSKRQQKDVSDEDTDSDLDPADVLMDYLTGKTGLAAVQLLRNEQLQAAVDNLISEDFQELGVTDKGAEIRKIVADIIEARDKGVPTTPVERKQRQGLGKVGPLRFRNLARAISRDKEEQEAGQDSGTAAATAEHVEPKAEDSSAANNQQ